MTLTECQYIYDNKLPSEISDEAQVYYDDISAGLDEWGRNQIGANLEDADLLSSNLQDARLNK